MTKSFRLVPWFLIAGLALLLIERTFHKALTTSFTHDESFTYNYFVTAPPADIFSYKVVSPNNHLLNTLLMKTLSHFFGTSEIVLRMPNVLAHLGFLLFSLLLFRKLNPWIILPLFVLVNCNPYMLDFFALARGNGLSLCFLLGSIYFFTRFDESCKTSFYAWSVLFAFLGVLSHFTLLYYILALFAVANLRPLVHRYLDIEPNSFSLKHYFRINSINLAFVVMLVIIMAGPIIKLIRADQLFYGGETGFWKDTVGTLIETFFYGKDPGPAGGILVRLLIGSATISTLTVLLYTLVKKDVALFTGNRLIFIVFLLLIITMLINVSQFYLLGTKLMIRRYGLVFVPMFMLVVSCLFVVLWGQEKIKKISLFVLYGLALIISLHTFSTFSATTYLDWQYEKETRKIMTIIEKDNQANHTKQPVTMGITWLFEPTVNFYRLTHRLTWLKEITREGPSIKAGYYYILHEDLAKVPLHGTHPLILFDDGRTMLIKTKQ